MRAQGTGKTKALLIGINYTGTNAQLEGCHNDALRMKDYLISKGFSSEPDCMRVLLDKPGYDLPTFAAISDGLNWLARSLKDGDSGFLHYSGHGGEELSWTPCHRACKLESEPRSVMKRSDETRVAYVGSAAQH